jgi:hypothetical protein
LRRRKLVRVVQSVLNVNISIATQEMTMSQKTEQDRRSRTAPTQQHKTQDNPITGLSPDDDVGVTSDATGKPGAPVK